MLAWMHASAADVLIGSPGAQREGPRVGERSTTANLRDECRDQIVSFITVHAEDDEFGMVQALDEPDGVQERRGVVINPGSEPPVLPDDFGYLVVHDWSVRPTAAYTDPACTCSKTSGGASRVPLHLGYLLQPRK